MRCIFSDGMSDTELEDWNTERMRHYAFTNLYRKGIFNIKCPKCKKKLVDTKVAELCHVDWSGQVPLIQVSCTSRDCTFTGYRVM